MNNKMANIIQNLRVRCTDEEYERILDKFEIPKVM